MRQDFLWQLVALSFGCFFSLWEFVLSKFNEPAIVLIRQDETLNFGDYLYLTEPSLAQIGNLDGFGEALTEKILDHDIEAREDFSNIDGIGNKRYKILDKLLLLK
ncbi:MAG: hypothetical protein NZT61_03020 [Deltaproteobacteria bacterium]|nr:hypothetical protein [Deltaproteobacteria bacterium]